MLIGSYYLGTPATAPKTKDVTYLHILKRGGKPSNWDLIKDNNWSRDLYSQYPKMSTI